jgi:hypothetical protein
MLTVAQQRRILWLENLIQDGMMNEKHFTLLTVRIPPDLQGVLEELSVEKGESVSTVVRAMIRKVAADVRRSGHETVLPLDGLVAAGSPACARDYK